MKNEFVFHEYQYAQIASAKNTVHICNVLQHKKLMLKIYYEKT